MPVPCDCTDERLVPPPGFVRYGNYDMGAPSGKAFCQHRKTY